MKKFFVLYSLKQKLTPTLYKTRITVVKHASTNQGLKFQEFDSQELAKTFIEKLSTVKNEQFNFEGQQTSTISTQKTSMPPPVLTQIKVQQILKSLLKNDLDNSNRTTKSQDPLVGVSMRRKQKKDQEKKVINDIKFSDSSATNSNSPWTILPNGHAIYRPQTDWFNKEQKFSYQQQSSQQMKFDNAYSSIQQNNLHKRANEQREYSQNVQNFQNSQSQQPESESTLISQQNTTQGNTQESSFTSTNSIRPSKKKEYWVLWSKHDYSLVQLGKRQSELGKYLYEMEKSHSSQWIKQNISSKQYKLKREAIEWMAQLKENRKFYLNKLKGEKLLQVSPSSEPPQSNKMATSQTFSAQIPKAPEVVINFNLDQQNIDLGDPIVFEDDQPMSKGNDEHGVKRKISKRQKITINPQFVINYEDIVPLDMNINTKSKTSNQKQSEQKKLKQQSLFEKLRWSPQLSVSTSPNDVVNKDLQNGLNLEEKQQKLNKEHDQQTLQTQQTYKQVETKQQLQNQLGKLQKQNQKQLPQVGANYQKFEQKQNLQPVQPSIPSDSHQNQKHEQKQQISKQAQQINPKIEQTQEIIQQTSLLKGEQTQRFSEQASQQVWKVSHHHPFNKSFIRQRILQPEIQSTAYPSTFHYNASLQATSPPVSQKSTMQQQEYEVYPSVTQANRGPGISIGSYTIKSKKDHAVVYSDSMILGQTLRQEGNLLALAFSISGALGYLDRVNRNRTISNGERGGSNETQNLKIMNGTNKNKVRILLSEEMRRSKEYQHKMDRRIIQTKQFVREVELKYQGKVEYVV